MALPEPSFIDRDPLTILAECVASYEAKTAAMGQPTKLTGTHQARLLIDIIVYREMLVRIGIQEAAKQNTWRYARYPMIDLLAEIVGPNAARLAARKSRTTLRFTLDAEQVIDTAVPAGTRVRSNDSKAIFVTEEDEAVLAGELTVDVAASASVAGAFANGYAPGQVTKLVDTLSAAATVSNITTTADGANEEDTEAMRERLPDALALQAAAGPEDAYRMHAKAVSPEIISVTVTSPTPGEVLLTILTKDGAPSGDLLDDVEAALSAETVRPINDVVSAEAGTEVTYTIDVSLILYKSEDEDEAIEQATAALEAYALERRSGLGRAPADGQIIEKIRAAAPGVYNVIVNEPTPQPVVISTAWARCTAIAVDVDSFVEERRPSS